MVASDFFGLLFLMLHRRAAQGGDRNSVGLE
jgi:hypothetical protein